MTLFDQPAEEPQGETPLTCAYGEPWLGPHPLCAAAIERSLAAYRVGVARGEYDDEGYRPGERERLAKRHRPARRPGDPSE